MRVRSYFFFDSVAYLKSFNVDLISKLISLKIQDVFEINSVVKYSVTDLPIQAKLEKTI